MRVLLIGYGSIGKRHYHVLKELYSNVIIEVVSRQNLDGIKIYRNLEDVDNLSKYDYFVIATETVKHYEQLKYLEKNLNDKIIFCEKPLFEKDNKLEIKNNQVFLGYNLRYHPIFECLEKELRDEIVYSVNVYCGSYLPYWRDRDYRETYSSSKELGGGVLLDLSHELDYVNWLFGKMDILYSYQDTVSELEISSDDITIIVAKTDNVSIINLSLDYFSKMTYRNILLHTENKTIEVDIIKNSIKIKHKNDKFITKKKLDDFDKNILYKNMHNDILTNQDIACTFEESMFLMKQIEKIQRKGVVS